MKPTNPYARLAAAIGVALLLAGCGAAEPDEAAIRQGLEGMHREWADQARRFDRPPPNEAQLIDLPRVNLAAEAKLDLQISEVRKLACRPPTDEKLGYLCTAEVTASIAGRPAVARRIEGRFVAGWSQWIATDVRALDVN